MAYQLQRWSLKDLYPGFDSPELESAFDQIEEQVTSFEGVRGKLRPEMPADEFLHVVKALEDTTRIIHNLDAFSGLSFAADTQDQFFALGPVIEHVRASAHPTGADKAEDLVPVQERQLPPEVRRQRRVLSGLYSLRYGMGEGIHDP